MANVGLEKVIPTTDLVIYGAAGADMVEVQPQRYSAKMKIYVPAKYEKGIGKDLEVVSRLRDLNLDSYFESLLFLTPSQCDDLNAKLAAAYGATNPRHISNEDYAEFDIINPHTRVGGSWWADLFLNDSNSCSDAIGCCCIVWSQTCWPIIAWPFAQCNLMRISPPFCKICWSEQKLIRRVQKKTGRENIGDPGKNTGTIGSQYEFKDTPMSAPVSAASMINAMAHK